MARLEAKVIGLCDAAVQAGHLPENCANCMSRHLAVCAGLDPGQLAHLTQHVTHRRLSGGQALFQEGDVADQVFTVTSGVVKQYKLLADGRCQVTGFYFMGDLIGMPEGKTYPVTAEALADVTLCAFPRAHITGLIRQYPSLADRVLLKFQREVTTAQEQMLSLGRLTAEERIARFLLMLMDKAPNCAHADGTLTLHMKRTDIADYLGLTVETVSRMFTKLRNAGVVGAESAGRIQISGRGRLAEMAGPD